MVQGEGLMGNFGFGLMIEKKIRISYKLITKQDEGEL